MAKAKARTFRPGKPKGFGRPKVPPLPKQSYGNPPRQTLKAVKK